MFLLKSGLSMESMFSMCSCCNKTVELEIPTEVTL